MKRCTLVLLALAGCASEPPRPATNAELATVLAWMKGINARLPIQRPEELRFVHLVEAAIADGELDSAEFQTLAEAQRNLPAWRPPAERKLTEA